MIDVNKIICEISGIEEPIDENLDLFDNEILDSFGLIELLSTLEEQGINIIITRIDREKIRTIKGIKYLVENYKE